MESKTKEVDLLDEKGFVFVDENSRPFWVRMWGNSPWIFRWHADKRWVSLRQTNQSEIFSFASHPGRLKEDAANLYHTLNDRP